MFDFQKLTVYQKAKDYANSTIHLIKDSPFDRVVNDQFKRASLSIMLNIAEGSSRFSKKDRRNFMVISRGSVFECVAILDFLKDNNEVTETYYDDQCEMLEEISKMLFSMIRNLE